MTRLSRSLILGLSSMILLAAPDAAAPAPAPEKVVDKKNGVKRPEPSTITGKLWVIADRISISLRIASLVFVELISRVRSSSSRVPSSCSASSARRSS